MAIHRIPATPETVRWGVFDAAIPPILTVNSGDTVVLECVSGGGNAAKERRKKIGNPLRHQLLIGVVPVANHAIGNARAQQRFDCAQERDGNGRRDQVSCGFPLKRGQRRHRQARRKRAKFAANGLDRQMK